MNEAKVCAVREFSEGWFNRHAGMTFYKSNILYRGMGKYYHTVWRGTAFRISL